MGTTLHEVSAGASFRRVSGLSERCEGTVVRLMLISMFHTRLLYFLNFRPNFANETATMRIHASRQIFSLQVTKLRQGGNKLEEKGFASALKLDIAVSLARTER